MSDKNDKISRHVDEKRQAMQITSQLPSDKEAALRVLGYCHDYLEHMHRNENGEHEGSPLSADIVRIGRR